MVPSGNVNSVRKNWLSDGPDVTLKRRDFKIQQSAWSSNYNIFIKDKATSM